MIAIKSMKNIPKSCSVCGLKDGSYCYHKKPPYDLNGINVLKERASNCPLVEIITCKDCIKGQREHSNSKKYCMWTGRITEDDFYCKDGKRREQK